MITVTLDVKNMFISLNKKFKISINFSNVADELWKEKFKQKFLELSDSKIIISEIWSSYCSVELDLLELEDLNVIENNAKAAAKEANEFYLPIWRKKMEEDLNKQIIHQIREARLLAIKKAYILNQNI